MLPPLTVGRVDLASVQESVERHYYRRKARPLTVLPEVEDVPDPGGSFTRIHVVPPLPIFSIPQLSA